MKRIPCLLLEDEPLAAEVLQDYIAQVPFLDLRATCANAVAALEVMQREPISLLFLDIHLPRMNGLAFLKTIAHPPKVIITTAYPDFALEGYELNVVDYLLKPVEWSRFLMAVNKLNDSANASSMPAVQAEKRASLFFNVNKRRVRVYLDEILYIESIKEYIRIATTGKTILTKCTLQEIEELLTPPDFLRIHRSFIVAKDKIETYSATDIEVAGKQLPVGRLFKDTVWATLEAGGS